MTTCNKCKGKNIDINTQFKFHNIYSCQDCNYWTYQPIDDCCRATFKIIVIDRKNHDLSFIREQCLHCGGCINKSKPLSFKKFGDQIRGELSESREKERWENYYDEKNILANMKEEYRYYNSPWYKYYLYLGSDTWKQKRKLVFERDSTLCQICKTETATEVHHLSYQNIYNEPLEDLIAICQVCHKKEHNKPHLDEINQGMTT